MAVFAHCAHEKSLRMTSLLATAWVFNSVKKSQAYSNAWAILLALGCAHVPQSLSSVG